MIKEEKKERYFGLLVAFIAFLVYANSLGNGFVMDDPSIILDNPALQGTPLSVFSSIDTPSDTQLLPYYRPVSYLIFMLEHRLHGMTPFLVRLFNVLLHTANAFLVYRLARALITDRYAALLAALLFAVHPLNTEGADFNGGGRTTLLSCFFVLMAYLLLRRSIIRNNISSALAGAVLFLAGLFSKETAMMAVPFIVAQEVAPLRHNESGSRLRAAIRLLLVAAAVICYLVMRWMALSKFGIQAGIVPGFGAQQLTSFYVIPGLGERLLKNLYIIPRYLLTVVRPTELSPRYVIPDDLHMLALPLAAAWLCIVGILGWLLIRGRNRATLFGLSWLAAFYLPVSGIFWFASAPLADRFLYIPAIGIWIVVADQAARLLPSGRPARRYGMAAAAIILLILAGLTVTRNPDWKNDMTLFSRLVEQYPDNPYGHAYLGAAYFNKRNEDRRYPDLAEQEFERALESGSVSQEDYALMVHTRLGHILQERRDYEDALYHYNEALAIYPLDKEALINRGKTFDDLGRYKEAVADYQLFLTIPGYNNISGSRQYAEERLRELSKWQ